MGAVAPFSTAARPFIATSTVASGLPALRTTASAHNARLISGGTMGEASTSTVTTSFTTPTITLGLANAITTARPAILTTVMAVAGSKQLAPAPETSEREHLAPTPQASELVHHAGRTEHHRDGSQFHRLADRVRHLQHQQRHQTANSPQAGKDRDTGAASACQH